MFSGPLHKSCRGDLQRLFISMLHCLCYYACSILLFVPLFRASHAFRDQYSKLKHVYAKQSHQYDIFLVAVQLLTFKNSLQILRQNKVGGVIYTILDLDGFTFNKKMCQIQS